MRFRQLIWSMLITGISASYFVLAQSHDAVVEAQSSPELPWDVETPEVVAGGPVSFVIGKSRALRPRSIRVTVGGEEIGDLSHNAVRVDRAESSVFLVFKRPQPRQEGATLCIDPLFATPGPITLRLSGGGVEDKEVVLTVALATPDAQQALEELYPCWDPNATSADRERSLRFINLVLAMGELNNIDSSDSYRPLDPKDVSMLRRHPDWNELVNVLDLARESARAAALHLQELDQRKHETPSTSYLEPLRAKAAALERLNPRLAFAAGMREQALNKAQGALRSSDLIEQMKERR